ncbi:hypothetical protein C8R44DRAFT_747221 [Mycena epipterygia]|nr:hypothetical protein C8R44DRAFT_747221 [Mycena epipterygia]
MSASSRHDTAISSPSQLQGGPKAFPTTGPTWLQTLLFNAKMITAGANALPFPYMKGVFSTVVFLLETVEKVKKNQESMKELCADTVDIITVSRDQLTPYENTASLKFKAQCEELQELLNDILEAVDQLKLRRQSLGAHVKEIIKASSTMDDISRFRTRIRELQSNFMLMATMDTNFQVQKILTVISPSFRGVDKVQKSAIKLISLTDADQHEGG